jgi:hypothetical protein
MKTSSADFKLQLVAAFSPQECWLDGSMATLSSEVDHVVVGSSRDISPEDVRLLRRLYVWSSLLKTACDAKREMLPDSKDLLNQNEEIEEALVGAVISELEYHLVLHLFDHEVLRLFSEKVGVDALSHFALITKGLGEFSVVLVKKK